MNNQEQNAATGTSGNFSSAQQGGKEQGGSSKMDPRTAREFKPSATPSQFVDGPPINCVINYLSSECVSVNDLHWWTSDKHLLDAAALAGVKLELKDIVFAEHKVNGKSKGSVTINCRSPERASMLMHWFHSNDFQGKKLNPTYLTNGSTGKINGYNPSRPAANVPSAAPFATNAHGGINFNRLRPLNRPPMPQVQHGGLGMGRPPKGLFHKIESGQLGIQDGMQYGEWPRQAAGGWAALQSHYPTYSSVDLDHPGNSLHGSFLFYSFAYADHPATPGGALPYGDVPIR